VISLGEHSECATVLYEGAAVECCVTEPCCEMHRGRCKQWMHELVIRNASPHLK
jgi:hypothetical protein